MKKVDRTNSVITLPDTMPDSPTAVVLFGGLYHWEGGWFLTTKQIPDSLLEKAVFLLPKHYTNDLRDGLKELAGALDGVEPGRMALCGYSRGGIEVYRYRSLKDWAILGLIDPSAPTMGGFSEDVLDSASSKVRCVYWVPNWGKDGYDGKIPSFAAHLRKLRVKMTEKETKHRDMPRFFFDTYGADLVR